ncbi:hypothetical protein GR254_09515, partial [Mycobacterium tuberculosis]|nr:hypothetical protein [Mycobacterium tuberculosis]
MADGGPTPDEFGQQRVRPAELRYYLGSAHYRSMLEFSETAMQDAV